MRRSRKYLFVGLGIAFLFLAVTCYQNWPRSHADIFIYDALLGWRTRPNLDASMVGSRLFQIQTNVFGFRDPQWRLDGARPRLAVLGDSFVWGYDADNSDLFTQILRERQPQWEMLNLGVSAYGPDQSLLLAREVFPTVKPNAVLFLFCTDNDFADGQTAKHGNYAKPMIVKGAAGWQVFPAANPPNEGQIPASAEETLLLIRSETHKYGGRFLLASIEPSARLSAFSEREKIPYLALQGVPRLKTHGRHWGSEGHRAAANQLLTWLQQELVGDTFRVSHREALVFNNMSVALSGVQDVHRTGLSR